MSGPDKYKLQEKKIKWNREQTYSTSNIMTIWSVPIILMMKMDSYFAVIITIQNNYMGTVLRFLKNLLHQENVYVL